MAGSSPPRSGENADGGDSSPSGAVSGTGSAREFLRGELAIPSSYQQWHRVSQSAELTVVEYWKRGSTHVLGSHEQLRLSVSRDGETARVVKQVYDRFGHTVPRATSTLTEQPVTRSGWIEDRVRKYMDRYPGAEGFTSPPEFPARIGQWTAVCRQHYVGAEATRWVQHYDGAEATRWVFDPADTRNPQREWGPVSLEPKDAVFSLEETNHQASYSTSTRYYTISYHDARVGETTVATDVPRLSAFEIAHFAMRSLDSPVGLCTSEREALEAIDGIGPAKSRDLLLLGISDPADLRDYLAHGSPVGHHHADRVDALLTSRIRGKVNQ